METLEQKMKQLELQNFELECRCMSRKLGVFGNFGFEGLPHEKQNC